MRFYRTRSGGEPVRQWLKTLPLSDRRIIGLDFDRVQAKWPIGMPLCRSLGGGLSELRLNLPSNRTARVLFFVYGGRIGVVHGFIKKTQKIPTEDLDLARARMKEMLQ